MRSSHPPIVATWFLDHLCSDTVNQFLIGDLVEEYGHGRSGAWYWKQAVSAIVVSSRDDVRAHILIAIKALITGWAAQFMFQFVALGLLGRFQLWLPVYHRLPLVCGIGIALPLTWLILWTPIWISSGWFVGAHYRPHLASMVLMFSLSVFVWKLLLVVWTVHLLSHALGDPRYFPRLCVGLMNLILPSIYIVLGGLLVGTSKRDSLAHRAQIIP